jgi:hypothetical protein
VEIGGDATPGGQRNQADNKLNLGDNPETTLRRETFAPGQTPRSDTKIVVDAAEPLKAAGINSA